MLTPRRPHQGPPLLCLSILLPLVLAHLGCSSEDDSGPAVEVRDSSGVTIVENSGSIGPDGGGWVLNPEPEVSIGTFQGDSLYQLFEVQGAVRLSDGRIALANAGSGEIRVYGDDGRFLAAHGRKGEGPGEFQNPVLVGSLGGDTLVVVDQDLRRISLVGPDEGFLQAIRISDDIGGGAFPRGMFHDGVVVMGGGFYWSSSGGDEMTSGFSRQETNYWAAGLDGELLTDFGQFPGAEFFMEVKSQPGGGVSMRARLIPFGKYAMAAVAPNQFYFGAGDTWEVRGFDQSGSLTRIYRLDEPPIPVGSGDLEAVIEEEVAQADDPSEAPEIRAGFGEMPLPDFMPAFSSIQTDQEGYLWVERFRRPGEDTPVFDILDPREGW